MCCLAPSKSQRIFSLVCCAITARLLLFFSLYSSPTFGGKCSFKNSLRSRAEEPIHLGLGYVFAKFCLIFSYKLLLYTLAPTCRNSLLFEKISQVVVRWFWPLQVVRDLKMFSNLLVQFASAPHIC